MGFSLAVESGDRSVAVCRLPVASSVVQHRLSGPWASVVRACRLECGPRSCGVWAWLLQGMRDLPGPGMGPRISCIGRRTLLLSHQRSPIPVTSDHTSPPSDHETLKREVTSSPPLNVPMRIRDTFVE